MSSIWGKWRVWISVVSAELNEGPEEQAVSAELNKEPEERAMPEILPPLFCHTA
jgi:hypothetical protein